MHTQKLKALIIDDNDISRKMLSDIISKKPYIEIYTASNGSDGIDLCLSIKPDVILLDVVMPGMSGFDVAERLKSKTELEMIPILFITVLDDIESKEKGFDTGAIDYITKPFNEREVFQRVLAHLKLKLKFDRTIQQMNEIKHELELANKIQSKMFPYTTYNFSNITIACEYFPYREIGGDFFHIHQYDENSYLIFICDVTGHGIPAALYTMVIYTSLQFIVKTEKSPANIMSTLSTELYELLIEDYFVTACCIHIDIKKKTITYCNAAHPPALYYRESANEITKLDSTNTLIGIHKNESFLEATLNIEKNSYLFIYTDGLIEMDNQSSVPLDYPSLFNFIISNKHLGKEYLFLKIIDYIMLSSNAEAFTDDISIIISKFENI